MIRKRTFSQTSKGSTGSTGAKRIIYKKRRIYRNPSLFGKTNIKELKTIDYTNIQGANVRYNEVVHAATLATGMTTLNLLQAGTGFWNVIGSKIIMKSIKLSFIIYPGTAAAGSAYDVRWLLIYDRQPNGVAALITNILATVTQTGASTLGFESGTNIINRKRFQIVKSGVTTISTDTKDSEVVSFYKKLNHQTEYNGTANPATIANISTGALYFITFGSQTLASNLNPLIGQFESRIRYED